jgi:hypothetical protein
MSNTASLGRLHSGEGFFGKILALLGSALDRFALAAARNADQPYFGL